MIDDWWLRLPEAARPQIRERFMDSAPAVHLGGFFELYMHEVLRRVCSEVEADIGNDDTYRRRPDLRAMSGDVGFGVEVTAILGDDAVDPKDRATPCRFGHFSPEVSDSLHIAAYPCPSRDPGQGQA